MLHAFINSLFIAKTVIRLTNWLRLIKKSNLLQYYMVMIIKVWNWNCYDLNPEGLRGLYFMIAGQLFRWCDQQSPHATLHWSKELELSLGLVWHPEYLRLHTRDLWVNQKCSKYNSSSSGKFSPHSLQAKGWQQGTAQGQIHSRDSPGRCQARNSWCWGDI